MRRSVSSIAALLMVCASIPLSPAHRISLSPSTTRPAMAVQPPAKRTQTASIGSTMVTPNPPPQPTIQPPTALQAIPNSTTTATPTVTQLHVGSKYDWMRSAGIPESDWQYVDFIVTKEASWNPLAVNPSSGACSLAQALPCSKIPGDWRDPVTALRWQHAYVLSRYGSYAAAYSFWLANGWY